MPAFDLLIQPASLTDVPVILDLQKLAIKAKRRSTTITPSSR
jgi:hypothetical protein